MKSIELIVVAWALSGDTGTSSKTIARHMLGIESGERSSPPWDAADRGRCIRLLRLVPEWVPRLTELADAEKPKESLVFGAGGMRTETNNWAKQIPLIIKEGNFL